MNNIYYETRCTEFEIIFKQLDLFLKFMNEVVTNNTENCLFYNVEAVNNIPLFKVNFKLLYEYQYALVIDLAKKYEKEYN